MAKDLSSLKWVEDFLPEGSLRKHMFGGFAYYVDQKIVLVIFESEGDRSYKNQTYQYDIWNGCLFPTQKENHARIKKLFPVLVTHPVLPKWLYLPVQTEDFESHIEKIMREIRKGSELFGVIPKVKKKKSDPSKISKKVNTKRPQMFQKN